MPEGGRGGGGEFLHPFKLWGCSQSGRNWVDNILWRRMLGMARIHAVKISKAFILKCLLLLLGLHGQITKGLRIPFFK